MHIESVAAAPTAVHEANVRRVRLCEEPAKCVKEAYGAAFRRDRKLINSHSNPQFGMDLE
ncbi:hypothetical protein GCM10020370_70830 [Paenibacillus hodogayensis]